jgi:hypothetical protein
VLGRYVVVAVMDINTVILDMSLCGWVLVCFKDFFETLFALLFEDLGSGIDSSMQYRIFLAEFNRKESTYMCAKIVK